MKKPLLAFGLIAVAFCTMGADGAGCDGNPPTTVKAREEQKSIQAANSVHFDENAERENIVHRLQLTADPGKLGFILLLNHMGQPILYEGVKGKITSSHKRLTPPDYASSAGAGNNNYVRQSASDEGTFGQSDDYIYYWNTEGVYRQWSGLYLYSDQPIRTSVPPLVISNQQAAK